MKNPRCLCPLLVAFSFLLCSSLRAQNANLSGLITDTSDAAVPGAKVLVVNKDTGAQRKTSSNDSGFYGVPQLPPGTYEIHVDKEGFQPLVRENLRLEVAQNATVDLKLQVGDVKQTVTVEGGAEMINTTDGSVSTVVDRQFVENMPLNGRSFQSLITLTPGVVAVPGAATGSKGEFSINGQRTEANYYAVDGVSANTGSNASSQPQGTNGGIPGESALGTTQSLVSLDALQEFRIQTSTYSAEYGRTPGGQISFVTRAGTNELHGSAFEYLRNGVFDTNNWFNNANRLPKAAERQNDFGGTFGGPVRIPGLYNGKDKTFFFFSYEGLRVSTPQPAQITFVPDIAMRQTAPNVLRPYLNAYPVPNGPENGATGMAQFIASFSNPGSVDSTGIRIDHNFSSKLTVFGRFNDSPSHTTTRGGSFPLSNPNLTVAAIKTLTIGATGLFTSRLANQIRFNYGWNESKLQRTLDNFGGAVPLDLSNITDLNGQPTPGIEQISFQLLFGGSGTVQPGQTISAQRQQNVVDTLSYSTGRHLLKFGVDFRRIITPLTLSELGVLVRYSSLAQVQQNLPAQGQISGSTMFPLAPIYTNLSLFAQDEWKATQRLSLSLGLRWELNPPPTDAYGNLPYNVDQTNDFTTMKLAPKGTNLWNTTYRNFAPRLGVAYKLRQSPERETILRGGFGVFYDLGSTQTSRGYGGVGIGSVKTLSTGTPFPYTATQLSLPPASVAAPYNTAVFAFDRNLQLPYTLEWNIAIEQALGNSQSVTLGYVGAAARRLLWSYAFEPAVIGNPNFTSSGSVSLVTNRGTSDYAAMQAQYRRRLSHGLQALASYTWSHSIDDVSVNSLALQFLRASSDFDVRHNVQAAITYDVPAHLGNQLAGAVLRHWSVDTRLTGHSGLPFDVSAGSLFDSTGTLQQLRADIVPGQPIYISDPAAPGGRRVNFNAFTQPTAAEKAALQFGNAPRNFLRGFPAWQVDLAVRREFPLHERLKLQFRAEAFNIFNHPIFGAIQNDLTTGSAVFGRATGTLNNQLGGLNSLYQQGGPRSIQFALRLVF